ncbi:N-formylglutamate amidohydrolase [Qipengyuania sp. S6317L1]|uniref:N-formylglutamate amidohydrolase n=1 Tax=Qipengyuania sp. S6317L1 TaxID=2926410 RepID=UPI001FF54D6E|nr:N-formylglutamate amidohydrolase [Qipengyuania sp. S6317L1]MCK0099289.1 N-formylglutamate amidohydrolase [Qipengyuania sp. S6317L1]
MRSHSRHHQQAQPASSPRRASTRDLGEGKGYVTTKGGTIASDGDGDDQGEGEGKSPAFVHVAPRDMPLPVLIAVPHAGCNYSEEIVRQMRDPGSSQLRLEDRRVDAVGVEIARATGTGLLVAHAPRAIIDLNRASDDIDWGMVARPKGFDTRAFDEKRASGPSSNARARSGLGIVPRRLPGTGEIWRSKLSYNELARRIEQIHRPYHAFLEGELARIRDAWGAALLIDLHSMPPLRRRNNEEAVPKIVIGDRYGASCDHILAAHAFRYLEQQGQVASHNRPYSGGYVLDRHARPNHGIHAIQIELCRSSYLDPSLSEPSQNVRPLAQMLAGLVRILGAETAGLGSGRHVAQAAE